MNALGSGFEPDVLTLKIRGVPCQRKAKAY
jgi:hypothetical protein